MNPAKYVLGFMFSPSLKQVVLIEKLKPDWQRGKLNGVGGKIEEFDAGPVQAMCREYREETGVETAPQVWTHVACIKSQIPGEDVAVDVFATRSLFYRSAESTTDERVVITASGMVPTTRILPNLEWLIPMCKWVLKKEIHIPIDMAGGLA